MDTQATYDDVKLIMRLYEMRRDEKLREARQWFAKFNARTWAEKVELCPPGSEPDAYFRMVTTYWEMVASFITSGVLHQELFLQSGQELLFVWERSGISYLNGEQLLGIQKYWPTWRRFRKPRLSLLIAEIRKRMRHSRRGYAGSASSAWREL
jgi:hypothetical protein